MAITFPQVQPGDIITAKMINDITKALSDLDAQVQSLGGAVGGGPVAVPYVLGQTLASAEAILTQPTFDLLLGNTIDAFGNVLDPDLADARARIVINQIPTPGTRVTSRSVVDLVLSAKPSGSTPQPSQAPVITDFSPSEVPMGQQVAILGRNFALNRMENTVTIGGVQTNPPTSESTVTTLFVEVPESIPNPPTAGQKKPVTVVVTTLSGGSATSVDELLVLPALAGDNPRIDQILDSTGADSGGAVDVDELVTIVGEHFADALSDNVVSFGSVTVVPQSGSDTQLVVEVPEMPGHSPTNPVVGTNVIVTVSGRSSLPFPVNVIRQP